MTGMEGLVIFSRENSHPLSFLLHREFRHVWCALKDTERGVWVSYNWHQGLPILMAECSADYNLMGHYLAQGCTVVPLEQAGEPIYSPLILNNCVGHTKVVMGIRSHALTPYRLYKHLMKGKTMIQRLKSLFFAPGFGGTKAPAPPPPPEPLPPPPKRTDAAVQQARRDEQKRARMKSGTSGTVATSPLGTTTPAATTTSTLLGN